MPSPAESKRDIQLFLALLIAFSSVFYAVPFVVPDAARQWGAYSGAFMWCPGLAALLTQLVRHRTLRGFGWGWGGAKYYALAYALPLAFCIPVYLCVWSFGLGDFNREALETARSQQGLPTGLLGHVAFVLLGLALAPLGMLATLGEELGWRGLLVPRLATLTDLRTTSLITGVIWALWHYPVNFAVVPFYLPHIPMWYASACFTVSVVGISYVYTWLWMRSSSVWPAVLLHATSNAFQGYFEGLTKHSDVTSYFTYEYGIGFSLVMPFLAFPFWRRLAPAAPDQASMRVAV